MTDPFDAFLAAALEPPSRDPDRIFVAKVQARNALEERLRATRNAELRALGLQALAVFAVAGALLLLLRSHDVARLAEQLPGMTLIALLCAFGLLVPLLSAPAAPLSRGC